MKEAFLAALKKEIELQRDYLKGESIKTIYFGGGTPSLLTATEIIQVILQLEKHHVIEKDIEITLEANPDDLTFTKIKELRQTPVNRLSIGIQSFFEEDLKWMNRAHTAVQAKEAILNAQQQGFINITIDFIYGLPTLSHENWLTNLKTAFQLNIPHVSAYSLTIEPRTALASYIKKGKYSPPDEEKTSEQFEILMEQMRLNGYIHYEISNFAKEGYFSKHNTSYWKAEKYLGLGPSAHSFNHTSRQWNIANNALYIKSLSEGLLRHEKEELSQTHKLNEYILTSLRTIWGSDLKYIKENFPALYYTNVLTQSEPYISKGLLTNENSILKLSQKGKLFADKICSDLFHED